MDKTQKAEAVEELNGIFAESGSVVVAHYTGLTVSELEDLRRQMRAEGALFKIAKNRLAKRALDGKAIEGISAYLSGPTGIAYSKDPVAAARVAVKFAKDHEKLVVLGGSVGETVLDANGVKSLAELPSLDELRGKLVGLLKAPATKIAGVAAAPASTLARVFSAYSQKDAA